MYDDSFKGTEMSTQATQPKAPRKKFNAVAAVVLTILIYIGAQIVAAVGVALYPELRRWSRDISLDWLQNSIYAKFFSVVVWGVATVWMVNICRRFYGITLKELGLVRPKWFDMLYSLAGFGVYFLLLAVAIFGAEKLIGIDTHQAQQLGFSSSVSGYALVLTCISLVFIPPIVEEILCRGFLLRGLMNSMRIRWAAVITSMLFAVAHLQFGSGEPLLWAAAIDTFVLSLVLVYLRIKTGSLWPAIGLHAIKNSLAFVAIFVLKG
jgi:membrane protease YdiL (CAAX protease family)